MNDLPAQDILLTGASGFVGSRVEVLLQQQGAAPRTFVRRARGVPGECVGDLQDAAALAHAVRGMRVVIHCAGYAHAFNAPGPEAQRKHRELNLEVTRKLAEAAAAAGVRRFVFCSSVKAMGEPGQVCVDETYAAAPDSDYGIAKLKAEQALAEIAARSGMQIVNLRLAMVYGPASRGNLERMFALVRRGWMPPLPETGNRRSMVYVDDAAEAILLAATHERAANRTFIVAHPDAVSGRALYEAMHVACNRALPHWTLPEWIWRGTGRLGDGLARLSGRRVPFTSETVCRLLDSACYSSAAIIADLGWQPRVSLQEGLRHILDGQATKQSDPNP